MTTTKCHGFWFDADGAATAYDEARRLGLPVIASALPLMHHGSRRQLAEVLADFWHNHFNVYGPDSWAAPVWSHWDRVVIRGNALGNFRTMLGQVAEHPAMLYYLDNYTNTSAGPNENWARELFELNTLGAENYLGVKRQADVPVDGAGAPTGYVDDDVFEATRCFTGWTFDFDTGLFDFQKAHEHPMWAK